MPSMSLDTVGAGSRAMAIKPCSGTSLTPRVSPIFASSTRAFHCASVSVARSSGSTL